jgi:hypothetical protein
VSNVTLRPFASILLVLLPAACADEGSDVPSSVFASEIETLVFEIDAMAGAEPEGAMPSAIAEPWELLETNMTALFEGSPRDLVLPGEGELGALEDVPEGDLDVEELVDLADRNRDVPDTDDTAVFHIMFVDRYHESEGVRQDDVLGVSIHNTRVIAMFAPVYKTLALSRYVEQSTLIHEIGHAAGLVDNGVAMVEPHRDPTHGAHCNEEQCVMYWLNEGASDLREYIADYVTNGDVILFDEACLADARAAAQ